MGKKDKAVTILSILLITISFICLSSTMVKADISIFPGIQTISMENGFPKEPVEYKVRVNNRNNYDVIVAAKPIKPDDEIIKENYTTLPNSSWLNIRPDRLYISAGKHRYFNVSFYIPDKEQHLYYNEKWDVRVIFEEIWSSGGGGVDMRVRIGTTILVHTPIQGTTWKASQNLGIIVGMLIGIVAVSLVIIFIKKKKSDLHKKL